jgi:flagellar motor switch protein FliM
MTNAIPLSAIEGTDEWQSALDMECLLTLEIPVPGFTVRELLRLAPGTTVATHWSTSDDVPLRASGQPIAWATFEAKGERLAARLAELA